METVTPGWGLQATAPPSGLGEPHKVPPVERRPPSREQARQVRPKLHPEDVVISRPPPASAAPASAARGPSTSPVPVAAPPTPAAGALAPSVPPPPSVPPRQPDASASAVPPEQAARPSATAAEQTVAVASTAAAETSSSATAPASSPAREGTGTAPSVQTQTAKGPDPIRELSVLATSENVEPLLQRPVELTAVKVDEVLGSYFFAVRMPDGAPILIGTPEALTDVSPGDRLDVIGGVRKVPAEAERLALGDRLTKMLKARPIYIQARRIDKPDAHP